ncbi:MAG TPA: hypothetical protein VFA42_09060 [Gaiellaceae bacterium]|jgi:hypothetical protein|nr:hypothetical protein [Gaiellaceae bacterium]
MNALRRHRLGITAFVLVALAALLVLFAFDTRAWQSSVNRDDIRFRAILDHGGLWQPKTILPGDPAGEALGTKDTIAWRRALQSFWSTHIGANPQSQEDLPKLRAQAQSQLLDLTSSGKTAAERSGAANLLGVLVITTPVSAGSQSEQLQVLKQSIDYFQRAIELDPGDTAAKENLELVLRATRPGKGRLGRDAHAGFGFGRGHGTTIVGNGY